MKLQKIVRVCGLFALLALGALQLSAANVYAVPIVTISPASLLNADGTLDLAKRAQGSLNLKGWQVSLDPQRGPVLTANEPNVPGWSAVANGVNGRVSAMAFMGTDLYIGGSFTEICGNATCDSGNLPIKYIAKWNGSSWSALGFGVDEPVNALAVNGSDLYVGGYFEWVCMNAACNAVTTVNHIAKWDGSEWSKLIRGVGGPSGSSYYSVDTITVVGSDVYVGGYFPYACGSIGCSLDNIRVNNVAKWNGSNWSALGFGLNSSVDASVISGDDLYIGGDFAYRCGNETCASGNVRMNNIAKWSLVTNSWSSLGYGLSYSVHTLKVNGGELYVGGEFWQVCADEACSNGSIRANRIAKWNGANWAALGAGVAGSVYDIEFVGNDIYVGGDFAELCQDDACQYPTAIVHFLAKWNGSAWSGLGYGVGGFGPPDTVQALATQGSEIYVVGNFPNVCGDFYCAQNNLKVNSITKYNPATACLTKPDKPLLWIPENNRAVNKRPTLFWRTTRCGVKYNIIIKDAATGKVVEKKTGFDPNVQAYRLAKPLTKGKSYKWFVEAQNDFGKRKSKARIFTVK